MINYLLITLLCLSFSHAADKKDDSNWTKPDLKGHWKLYDTEMVKEVPFLYLQVPEPNPMKMTTEDSPWDYYHKYDLVFENDYLYKVNYPVQAQAPVQYFLDTGYLHLRLNDKINAYPVELIHDTLIIYTPVPEYGFFKERYVHTNFNDSILNVMKKYGINYPELVGIWMLVREEDYDYGTHYELRFPHSIPDSIEFTREQMIDALAYEKIFMMSTDGIKRDYSFWYHESCIYFKPGKWYKEENDPMIHFYKK